MLKLPNKTALLFLVPVVLGLLGGWLFRSKSGPAAPAAVNPLPATSPRKTSSSPDKSEAMRNLAKARWEKLRAEKAAAANPPEAVA